MTNEERPSPPYFVGIEGGGTRTIVLVVSTGGALLTRLELGASNIRLLSDGELEHLFRSIAETAPIPAAVGIGMAGVRGADDCQRLLRLAAKVWPHVPCAAVHDLETALLAAERLPGARPIVRVVVLSGTGSCCYGRSPRGKVAKVGGWGHVIGDKGSGYEIGLRALKAVVYYYDRDQIWSSLGRRILRVLQLNEPNDLIAWAQNAQKKQIAALALEVFAAWHSGEKIARDILEGAAHSLARDAVVCARRLTRSLEPVEFVFAGSVFLKQPRFARMVTNQILKLWRKARTVPLELEGAWGAIELAQKQLVHQQRRIAETPVKPMAIGFQKIKSPRIDVAESTAESSSFIPPKSSRMSPTEGRNPLSTNLYRLPIVQGVRLMLSEETKVPGALIAEAAKIGRAVNWIASALKRGGRLFYVGAGTSGRLGVLDASECPPTFRTSPEQVQGIMAGGQQALWQSVEGAEDDFEAGARAIQFRSVTSGDVVVGIAASGRTPFVWGAIQEAKRRRAKSILLCFNPFLSIPRAQRPDLVIAPDLGPEVLTGSTRLKSGTATKLVLNILTTLSMVRLGKVVSNLMVDLNPSNTKLRDRAIRIVQELSGADYEASKEALEKSGWIVKEAWKRLKRDRPRPKVRGN